MGNRNLSISHSKGSRYFLQQPSIIMTAIILHTGSAFTPPPSSLRLSFQPLSLVSLKTSGKNKRHTPSSLVRSKVDGIESRVHDEDDDDTEVTFTIVQDLLLSDTGTEAHALEVFSRYAAKGFYEGQKYVNSPESFYEVLKSLDIEATLDDAEIVFRYLNTAGDGRLTFNNDFYSSVSFNYLINNYFLFIIPSVFLIWLRCMFLFPIFENFILFIDSLSMESCLSWYMAAYDASTEVADSFQSLIIGRRSVDAFDETKVNDDVLRRAVQCAVAAPNRSCSEPWKFISLGPETISKIAALKEKLLSSTVIENESITDEALKNNNIAEAFYEDWTKIAPGWCVVTCARSTSDNVGDKYEINPLSSVDPEDFKSVSCAIQNFMLSMWSEGIGTKWTTGPLQKTKEFAKLCDVDTAKEMVVGIIWYGYATGGSKYADPRRRRLSVDDVLSQLP